MTNANLSRMAYGYATSQILYAAVRLGVPDALAAGPVPVAKLADALDCDPGGLSRLIRALVVLGLAAEGDADQVELTEVAQPLRADHPRSMRSSVLLYGHPAIWQAWGALADGVRTGGSAFGQAHDRPLFDHLAEDPELSGVFNNAMREGTATVAAEVARAYDFTRARTVVDVGGGNGTLLAAVLTATPHARGILFDSVAGAADAPDTFRRAGLTGRWSIAHGDFFTGVPAGDTLLVKGILHDWDDTRCHTLLRHCRAAVAADGRLLVIEPVMPDRLDAPEAIGVVLSDIAMLAYTTGRERSRTEYRQLLAAAGFTLESVTAPLAGSAVRILTAVPVS
ncbi:methyltransferase [Actinoplanes sp. NPDC049599]|uniref:methyltransferase n=1 Tax=Actinoplanes sp. NPDC049599 TaxID=3363903 RepID=UPI003789B7F2